MTERQLIMDMMEKHKSYFENVKGVDVAFSTKGEYFFYEYNEKYQSYSTFVKFNTAEELEQIIEENIATDYCVNLQDVLEETLYAIDAPKRQELEVDEVSEPDFDTDRKLLVEAFVAFSTVIEKVYENLQSFKPWVEDMKK